MNDLLDSSKRSTCTINKSVETYVTVNVDIDIDVDDVKDFLQQATENELIELQDFLGNQVLDFLVKQFNTFGNDGFADYFAKLAKSCGYTVDEAMLNT